MMKQQKTLGDVAKRVLLNAMRFLLLPLLGAFCLTLSAQDVDGTRELALGDQCYEQKKYQEAFEHYTKASETGNAQAQYLVGSAYYTGEGTYRDYASAVTWFKRAAKKNHAKAQYNLAYFLIESVLWLFEKTLKRALYIDVCTGKDIFR